MNYMSIRFVGFKTQLQTGNNIKNYIGRQFNNDVNKPLKILQWNLGNRILFLV